MSRTAWGVLLLVSCAHSLAHVLELSLPGVEQQISADYGVGKTVMGWLAFCWRLPWGLGAIAAGALVDRYGGPRMLAAYLLGCAAMCATAGQVPPLPGLFFAMFIMGSFASIYHPAGLALIAEQTTPDNRAFALSIHGVFGSLGIGAAPLLAGMMLSGGASWSQYYWVLAILCGGLALPWVGRGWSGEKQAAAAQSAAGQAEDARADWPSFFGLLGLALLQGTVYSGVMAFLPRYFSESRLALPGISADGAGGVLAGGVLLLGCAGQMLAGIIARPAKLERQLAGVAFGNAPFLLAMGLVSAYGRLAAAGGFALVHFMHQPLYNTLVAKYAPSARRSLCYGVSFATGLGVGGLGAAFAGYFDEVETAYRVLAAAAVLSGIFGIGLAIRNRRMEDRQKD